MEVTINRFAAPSFPLGKIETTGDVVTFARFLVDSLSVNFHPDNDFADYIDLKTGERSFSDNEVEYANRLMSQCFDVCDKAGKGDGYIYDLMSVAFSPNPM